MKSAQVILFTRFPVPGEAKTRLIPFMGATGAAELQQRMTAFTVGQVQRAGLPLQIRFTGGTEAQMRAWLGDGIVYAPQGDGDLGQRMLRAFDEAFAAGAGKVLVVGCDCPDNRAANLLAAISALDRSPCVIGPAADGGYYLIGLTEPHPELFIGIDWGTASVWRQTTAKLDTFAKLPMLDDVDERDDIPQKLSVIIPAMNEADHIGSVVGQLLAGFNTEAIVVDGGSGDQTVQIAARAGATVITSEPGRATQMNKGAKQASGDLLLFLHADSVLPETWDSHVRRVLKSPQTSLGFFRFAIEGSFRGKRWVECATKLRSRLLKRPYGDQGIFLRRRDFFSLGGYPDVPILEDIRLVRQARKRGRVQCAPASLGTSGRRWQQHGVIKTTLINQAVLLAAWLGMDLNRLRDTYRAGRNPFRWSPPPSPRPSNPTSPGSSPPSPS